MQNARSKAKGDEGEAMAENFLRDKGYRILQRNYFYDRGEIDLIAEDGPTLVFVEVKTRFRDVGETAEESITLQKEKFLKRTAEGYLLEHKIERRPCRFDLVAVEWKDKKPVVRHVPDIFS